MNNISIYIIVNINHDSRLRSSLPTVLPPSGPGPRPDLDTAATTT